MQKRRFEKSKTIFSCLAYQLEIMCWSGSSAEWNRRSQTANRPNALFSICDWLFTNMESEHLSSRLQQYLLKQIPISKGLGISITEASLEEIRITAPLAPNLNHHGTAFGGSVSAVAILAGWTLVYARLEAEGQFPAVVIQHNEIRYVTPIEGAFSARVRLARPEQWSHFCKVCHAIERLGRLLRSRLKARVDYRLFFEEPTFRSRQRRQRTSMNTSERQLRLRNSLYLIVLLYEGLRRLHAVRLEFVNRAHN